MTMLRLGEHHAFEAAAQRYLYLVPSAAVFALDAPAGALIDALGDQPVDRAELIARVSPEFPAMDLDALLTELEQIHAVRPAAEPVLEMPAIIPLTPVESFPLTTAVLNVTNQCNLRCGYCYEYSEDKIVDTTNGAQPKFMTDETARQSIDLLFRESGEVKVVHVSFFGGETLMNYPVLSRAVPYAKAQAEAHGKRVEFNLTTNATLLTTKMIEFLAEEEQALFRASKQSIPGSEAWAQRAQIIAKVGSVKEITQVPRSQLEDTILANRNVFGPPQCDRSRRRG